MMRSRRLSLPALWLLAAALFCAKALMPVGWMPVADAGGIRIELCTGQGAISATLDAQGRLHKDGEEAPVQKRDICPFGVTALAACVPLPPLLAPAIAPAQVPPATLAPPAVSPLPHGPRPPTRGPPSLA